MTTSQFVAGCVGFLIGTSFALAAVVWFEPQSSLLVYTLFVVGIVSTVAGAIASRSGK